MDEEGQKDKVAYCSDRYAENRDNQFCKVQSGNHCLSISKTEVVRTFRHVPLLSVVGKSFSVIQVSTETKKIANMNVYTIEH